MLAREDILNFYENERDSLSGARPIDPMFLLIIPLYHIGGAKDGHHHAAISLPTRFVGAKLLVYFRNGAEIIADRRGTLAGSAKY